MAANPQFFEQNRLNASNALGNDFAAYKSQIFAMALAKPSTYFEMRRKVVSALKQNYLDSVHKDLYDLLSVGQVRGRSVISADGVNYSPSMPLQSTNQFCMDCASSINAILDEALEKILPASVESVMQKRLGITGREPAE